MNTSQQLRGFNPAAVADAMDIDIRGLLLMLWRRKTVIIGVLLIGLSLATIIITLIKPQYTGRSLLMVESAGNGNLSKELQLIMGSARLDTSLILGEIEMIRSRTMGRQVVERLNLITDPEFNPRFPARTAQEDAAFKNLSVETELETLPNDITDRETAMVVSRFLDKLNVRSIPGSFAIQIEYTSHDPAKAALIANTVVDLYIEQRLEKKFAASKKVTDWLNKRLAELRNQIRDAETAAVNYKIDNNIVEGMRTIVPTEQLSEINSQLIAAQGQKAEALARLEQIRSLAESTDTSGTVPDVIDSDFIQKLRLQKLSAESRLSELQTRYGERHPEILKIRSEIEETKAALNAELGKSEKTAESQLYFAEARVNALQDRLNDVTDNKFEQNQTMIKLRELEREAESSRLIFETFLGNYKRTDNQEDLQDPEARVISYAVVPGAPSYPNRLLMLSLSAAVSLFIGLTLAILLEKLDNTFRSATQLENGLRFPCYALIPALEKSAAKDAGRFILAKPSSTLAESVRTLRTVVNLRAGAGSVRPKVVMMTSSFPGEGKTTLSVWMARLAAKSGEKVILIDADLRRPSVHRVMAAGNDATLVEYLTGQKDLDQVVQRDEASGLYFIAGRSVPNSALDLISSERMKKLVASLSQVYDLVIIDSPACLAVSDARVLATLADQTLYAVAWDRTPREVVASGIKQFSDMNYNALAFVLTNVDVKRHVRYGYGDSVYYYGRYKEYFTG